MNEMHSAEPERRMLSVLLELAAGSLGIRGQAKSGNQREKCIIRYSAGLTQRVGVFCLDPDQPGQLQEIGAVVHVRSEKRPHSKPLPAEQRNKSIFLRACIRTLGYRRNWRGAPEPS